MASKTNKIIVDGVPLLLICTLALSLRIVYLVQFKETPLFHNLSLDPLFYDRSALSILDGDYLLGKKVLDMGPLYSYFLAAIYAVFGHDLFVARVLQALLGTLNCLLIYLIALNIFDKKVAFASAFMAAIYGPFIFTDGNLISESLVIFTNLFLILALIEARERDSFIWWYLSGLILGISAIIRPNILLFAPLAILWIIANMKVEGTAKTLFFCFLFFLGTITAIAPVTARNYLLAGDKVLITSSGGLNFYLGNNKDASGILTEPDFIRPDPAYEHEDARKEASRLSGKDLKASEASAFWFKKGIEYIRENPSHFMKLMEKKFFFLANAYEVPDNLNYHFLKKYSSLLNLPLLHYGIIFPLAMAGIFFSLKEWRKYLLLYFLSTSYIIFLLSFFITSRYRIPLAPYLILFSSFGLFRLWHFLKKKNYNAVFFFLLLFSLTFFYSNMDPEKERKRFEAQSHDSLGGAYYQEKKLDIALKEFEKAAHLLPNNPNISNNLAWAYAESGRSLDKARELSEFAVKAQPQNTGFLDTLAFVYFKMGWPRESEELIKKALLIEPENMDLRMRLEKLKKGRFL